MGKEQLLINSVGLILHTTKPFCEQLLVDGQGLFSATSEVTLSTDEFDSLFAETETLLGLMYILQVYLDYKKTTFDTYFI